jgi:hypothetical protein
MLFVHSSKRGSLRSSGLDSFAQYFLQHGCYVCYCTVLKCVGVVIILTTYAPLTVGSSPCLCSYVVDRSVYVDIKSSVMFNSRVK